MAAMVFRGADASSPYVLLGGLQMPLVPV